MKIYTKTGDDGTTGLFGGGRVAKDDPRVVSYGAVDELNCQLGAVRASGLDEDTDAMLMRIQSELFALGADLATPAGSKSSSVVQRITLGDAVWLEHAIDALTAKLPQLQTFILPGGSAPGAALHVARAICRRAEREVVTLRRAEEAAAEARGSKAPAASQSPSPSGEVASSGASAFAGPLVYLNRLSDFLFTLARAVNQRSGVPEEPWRP